MKATVMSNKNKKVDSRNTSKQRLIASLLVIVFALGLLLSSALTVKAGTMYPNGSAEVVKRTGQFTVLHYIVPYSGGSFTINEGDIPEGCYIDGAYAISYIRKSGHNLSCGHGINRITLSKNGGGSRTYYGENMYTDYRNFGNPEEERKAYGTTYIQDTGIINGPGTYTASAYVYNDDHGTNTGGERFSIVEVYVLVHNPSVKESQFGIVLAAKSGSKPPGSSEIRESFNISSSSSGKYFGGGNVKVWTGGINYEDHVINATIGGVPAGLTRSNKFLDGQGYSANFFEYSGTTSQVGTTIGVSKSNIGLWSTGFGFAYSIDTVAPTLESSMSMAYKNTNNPESGVTITGNINDKTPSYLTSTGLQAPKLTVTVDGNLTPTSVTASVQGSDGRWSDLPNKVISGKTVTVQLPWYFLNGNKVSYSIDCSVASTASADKFYANHEFGGNVRSYGMDTSYYQCTKANTSMNARYRITVDGDSHVTSVSAGTSSGTPSRSIVVNWNTNVAISGTTATGYHVVNWSDGNTTGVNTGSSSRTINVRSNLYYKLNTAANPYKIKYYKGSTDSTATPPADTACTYDSNVTFRSKGNLIGRSYTITFNSNIPSSATTGNTYSITAGTITGNLDPQEQFWKISGASNNNGTTWKQSETTTTPPNFIATLNGTVNATAQWSSKTVNGFYNPTMTGYIFGGWYDNAACTGNPVTSVNVAPATTAYTKTLYAKWIPITYTVNLYPNKPSNATNNVANKNPPGWAWSTDHYTATFTFDAVQNLPAIGNTYSLVGWDVTSGWFTAASGGTNKGSGNQKWNLTTTDKDTVNLYVHWTANTYEVRLYQNKPTEATNNVARKDPVGWTWNSADGGYYSATFTYDSQSALPELKSTYTLVGWDRQYGWCTSAPSGYLENTTIPRHVPATKKWNLTTTNGGTVKLYMGYIANTYTVTYNGNDNWNTSQGNYTQTLTFDKYETLTADKFNRNAPTPGRVYNGNAVDSTGKPLKEGYTFVGWSHDKNQRGAEKWSTDAAGNPVLPANTEIKNQSNARWNYTTAQGGNVDLYAIWKKNVSVTFNFTNGAFKGEKNSVTINYDMYNAEYDHVFDITEYYGKIIENGANNILQKSDSNGTNYRFLGYNINASEKNSPEPRFDVYSSTRNNTYKVADDQTIYAVWEPILSVDINLARVLGTMKFADGSVPRTYQKKLTAISPDADRKIETVIRPGEQGKYELTYARALESNKNPQLIAVEFDKRMNAMYNDPAASYYDGLNPVHDEPLEVGQKCGLNRLIENPSVYTLRKFYIPNYLGTNESPYQDTIYSVAFLISQPSYYYKNYVAGAEEESIGITGKIHLTPNSNPDGEPGGGGGGNPGGGDDIDTTLDDLRSKLKIRLK